MKHLPFFKVKYPSEDSEQVTIWHLLNQSSGLANPPGMLDLIHLEDDLFPGQVELAKRLVTENSKLKFEPGTQDAYTNLGYTV